MSAITRAIRIRTQFTELHYWPEAPESVAFLRSPHRHVFHVTADIEVKHGDRELEFFTAKLALDQWIEEWLSTFSEPVTFSCEYFADAIIQWITERYGGDRHITVEVNEDGENGGVLTYTPPPPGFQAVFD